MLFCVIEFYSRNADVDHDLGQREYTSMRKRVRKQFAWVS